MVVVVVVVVVVEKISEEEKKIKAAKSDNVPIEGGIPRTLTSFLPRHLHLGNQSMKRLLVT